MKEDEELLKMQQDYESMLMESGKTRIEAVRIAGAISTIAYMNAVITTIFENVKGRNTRLHIASTITLMLMSILNGIDIPESEQHRIFAICIDKTPIADMMPQITEVIPFMLGQQQ